MRVIDYITMVAGLSSENQNIIGAASTVYYGALLLFDREPRAAYTLLITGIELLSREYGESLTDWHEWELSKEWDDLFRAQGLSSQQAGIFRAKLLADKHLRLGMTFRNYASSRVPDSFWDKPLDQWIPGVNGSTGERLSQRLVATRKISDFLQKDRAVLKNRLRESYSLRSSIVHKSSWIDLMKLGQPIPSSDQHSSSLSFPIELPDFQLLREGSCDV